MVREKVFPSFILEPQKRHSSRHSLFERIGRHIRNTYMVVKRTRIISNVGFYLNHSSYDHAFMYRYKLRADLHNAISDLRSVVYSFWLSAIPVKATNWDGSMPIYRFNDDDGKLVAEFRYESSHRDFSSILGSIRLYPCSLAVSQLI